MNDMNEHVMSTERGKWTLVGTTLHPQPSALLFLATSLSVKNGEDDRTVTFTFPNSSTHITIHRALLTSCPGPLEALVSKPFAEASSETIMIGESPENFLIVQEFLYCRSIEFHGCSPAVPFFLDRWGLDKLMQAYFVSIVNKKPLLTELFRICIHALAFIETPSAIKNFFVNRFVTEFEIEGIQWFSDKSHMETDTSMFSDGVPGPRFRLSLGEGQETDMTNAPSVSEHPEAGGRKKRRLSARRWETSRPGSSEHGAESRSNAYLPASNVWRILHQNGLLKHAIYGIVRFSKKDYTEEFLKLILIRLTDQITEGESEQILDVLDLRKNQGKTALKKALNWSMPARAWRALARSEAKQAAASDSAVVQIICSHLEEVLRAPEYTDTLSNSISVSDNNRKMRGSLGAVFTLLGISFFIHIETTTEMCKSPRFLRLIVGVVDENQEEYTEAKISCGLVKMNLTYNEIICFCSGHQRNVKVRHEHTLGKFEEGSLRTLARQPGALVVISPDEIDTFKGGHGQECTLMLTLHMSIESINRHGKSTEMHVQRHAQKLA